MTEHKFLIAFWITVLLIILTVQLQNMQKCKFTQADNKTAQIELYALETAYAKLDQLTQDLQQHIDRLDGLLMRYSEDNDSMSAQLRDFGEIMDEIGAREQEGYIKTH